MGKVEVIDLNNMNVGNVAKRLPKSKPIFVAFLADWCGHCQHFKPQWEMVKNELRMNPNKMNGMVITADDQLMRNLPLKQPSGFPTMSLYNGTTFVDDYKGMRSKEDVLAFIKHHLKERKSRKSRKSRKNRKSRKGKVNRKKSKMTRKSRRKLRRKSRR